MAQYGGGVRLDDPRVVLVQLLLYDMPARAAPTLEAARRWAEHFEMRGDPQRIVLVGNASLVGPASYAMVPGFQLVDKDFVLRYDSTGHAPRHNLFTELLPALGRIVDEQGTSGSGGSRPGQTMMDFTLADAQGAWRSFAELRAGRQALVYFYSGCCGHCSDELERVPDVARRFEERRKVFDGTVWSMR